jgi:hypothetical protein
MINDQYKLFVCMQYKLDIVDRLVNCKTIKCNYVEFLKVLSIKVTCLYFGKPEVNRADLSCIFSLREK